MNESDASSESDRLYSRTFLNARKEAWLILFAWLVCLVWTVGYAAFAGYDIDGTAITLIWGIPAWIVWGVLVPWLSATVFSVLFALFYMADDVLDVKAKSEG